MNLGLLVICALSVGTLVHGWVARGQTDAEKLEGHADQCWVEDIGYMKNGETRKQPKQCAEVTCEKDGAYRIAGCISVHVEPPCTVVKGDPSKPYPDCCFEVKCPEKQNKQ